MCLSILLDIRRIIFLTDATDDFLPSEERVIRAQKCGRLPTLAGVDGGVRSGKRDGDRGHHNRCISPLKSAPDWTVDAHCLGGFCHDVGILCKARIQRGALVLDCIGPKPRRFLPTTRSYVTRPVL